MDKMLPFVLLAFPILLLFLLRIRKTSKKPTFPPGPRGLPLIGNLYYLLDSSTLCLKLYELSKKYGPIFSLQLGSRPAIVISSPKLAKEVMKTHDLAFCGRPSLLSSMKLSYNGLDMAFSPYRDYWRHTRKISIIHFLSLKRVLMFSPFRKCEVSHLVRKISEHASCSKETNLHELLTCLTSALVFRTALGRRYEEEGIEKSMFHGLLKEAQELIASTFYTDYIPFVGGVVDKLTGLMGRLEKMFKLLDGFYQNAIDEHLDPERKKLTDKGDFIDALIQLKNDPSFSMHLTPSHIKPLMMNIILAGTETSVAAVVWAMTALMKNPRVMKKAQEEIGNVFGGKDFIEEDNIEKLPYLKAVIKETMRLYPPLPLLVQRETIKKCSIRGYEIPEKTLVYVNAWAVHRDPETWRDPEEFFPERFLNSKIDFRGYDYELIPFGAGRRICPGIHMGVITMELVLANLLHSFDWELPQGMKRDDIDTDMLPGLIQHKKTPLILVAKKRE
ncbi:cytochrome P450 83B1-like [Vigna radiata var. radiata]|uniref:Cytochrome P450 83B1-like n=1 Tax=Vigna radiata var. radiata TaxID=3916 RepID=A0A1S3TSP2_VIGRR|nr:cytochrome P450 83B1-like [Vigna radiata var. radiata]